MRILLSIFTLCLLLLCGCGNNNTASTSTNVPAEEPVRQPVTAENVGKEPATQSVTIVKAIGGVQPVSDADFTQKVLQNPGLTIVDFNATWCGPCRLLEPIFKKAAADFTGKASFTSMDVDENPATREQYKIQSIPLLLFFKDGKIVHRITGLPDKAELYQSVEKSM